MDERTLPLMNPVGEDQLPVVASLLLEQEMYLRSQLARDLHESIWQNLLDAQLMLQKQMKTRSTWPLRKADVLLGQAMGGVRTKLMNLRTSVLMKSGLGTALQNEIDQLRLTGPTPHVSLLADRATMGKRWDRDVEYAVFMISREALINAFSHASVGNITVSMRNGEDSLAVDIIDDGSGFQMQSKSAKVDQLGIIGMKERAIDVGAQFSISSMVGGGTRVEVMWRPSKTYRRPVRGNDVRDDASREILAVEVLSRAIKAKLKFVEEWLGDLDAESNLYEQLVVEHVRLQGLVFAVADLGRTV